MIRGPHLPLTLLLAGTVAVAVCGARPYAGGWNDGSRLAAVEAIADHGTLAIDDSIFVRPRPSDRASPPMIPPYPADRTDLLRDGTKDKLLINGRFYSDKPYSVSVVLAAIYRGLQWCGLPRAAGRPDLFCWTMTLLTSGAAYVCAVGCLHRAGQVIGLSARLNLLCTGSFAFATFAPTYSRHVNSHVMLLAVAAAVVLQLARMRHDPERRRLTGSLRLGFLGSAAVCLDPGGGPLLVLCLAAYLVLRYRSARPVIAYSLAAAPLVLLQGVLNYRIGGVHVPVNMVAEYSAWPGSAFSAANLTGFWRHTPAEYALYAASMLFGKRGIVGHNLPLLLLIPALRAAWKKPLAGNLESWTGLAWCAATWLLYAALSNNSSGACCSIRWFVPFLAPAWFVLAQDLREHPERQPVFVAVSLWGGVMSGLMWWRGPWAPGMVPGYWFLVAAALFTWWLVGQRRTATTGSVRGEPGDKQQLWNHESRVPASPPM